jgi:putative phosphoesterase
MTMKIGLISDTHMVRRHLPEGIVRAFQDVDMILHAGDLVTVGILESLEEIAPVNAVHGNMDMPDAHIRLPGKTIVEAEGKCIGLIHGHHVPRPNRVLPPPIDFDAMHAYLLSEFEHDRPDCIVYGHTHQVQVATYYGVLMVNPGSATRGGNGRHTVGLLTICDGCIEVRIVDLT